MRRNARIDAVGQREIDDAELAAEINRRLCPAIRQFMQPAAAPAGQHQGDRPPGNWKSLPINHFVSPV
jgi:hypothetical protein